VLSLTQRSDTTSNRLRDFDHVLDLGALTPEEFEAQKARILG
jgi:hypothetical protein